MPATTNASWGRGGRAALVVAVHAVLIYAVATSLGIVEMPKVIKSMEAVMIDAPPAQQELKPPVVQPDLAQPTLDDMVIPETPIDIPVEEVLAVEPAPAEPTAGSGTAISADLAVTRRVEPAYPSASRRLSEEGAVTIQVLVDTRGRAQQVEVVSSSGFPRLDEAAANAVKRWLFKPAMQNSQAVDAWTRVRVVFKLDT